MNKFSILFFAFLLAISFMNAATLTIEVQPANIGINTIIPSIGGHEYDAGQTVNLAASPYIQCPAVYQFNHWTGDVANSNSASTTVLMDADKTVTAVFTLAAPVCGDQCHPNFTIGDLNHDCIVDLGDFAVLASRWMNCTKPECDEVLPPADTEPPLPNPTTLTVNKVLVGAQWYHILTAGVVTDLSGVEYQFECVSNAALMATAVHVDWINTGNMVNDIYPFGATWYPNGTAKIPNKVWIQVPNSSISFVYRVRTRDLSPAQNTGQWSLAINSEGQIIESDSNPPLPNPAAWSTQPYQNSPNSIRMVAETAVDPEGNGVRYAFICSEDSSMNSGWIDSAEYVATGLTTGQTYTFRVKYRDNSANLNETDFSITAAVTMITFDVNPPLPNPAMWTTPPYQDTVNTIRMAAQAATDPEGNGVLYYFSCLEDQTLNSGWITSNVYVTPATLIAGQTYTFRVKYRDNSINQNETASSDAVAVVITDALDFTPPMPNPPTITAVRLQIASQVYHVLTAGVVMDPSGVEYRFECLTNPALIATAVHVDWINNVNLVAGIYPFNNTLFPNGTLKIPNRIYIPVTGSVSHTYRVKTRDQSPAHNESQWSQAVTTQ